MNKSDIISNKNNPIKACEEFIKDFVSQNDLQRTIIDDSNLSTSKFRSKRVYSPYRISQ